MELRMDINLLPSDWVYVKSKKQWKVKFVFNCKEDQDVYVTLLDPIDYIEANREFFDCLEGGQSFNGYCTITSTKEPTCAINLRISNVNDLLAYDSEGNLVNLGNVNDFGEQIMDLFDNVDQQIDPSILGAML